MGQDQKIDVEIRYSGSRGKNLETMLRRLKRDPDNKGYKLGWPASATYPSGATVSEVALWNEFGTRNPDGSVHTPERPFFRIANRQFGRIAAGLIVKFSKDGRITKAGTKQLAQAHTRLVKSSIDILKTPENAESTIESKGSSNPLIDTGLMRRTVTHELI